MEKFSHMVKSCNSILFGKFIAIIVSSLDSFLGSRFRMNNDFGYVTVDVTDMYERDQGVYTSKASNKAGETYTSTTVYCTSKDSLIEKTLHPKGQEGLEKIQCLEESLNRVPYQQPEGEDRSPPRFTSEV